MKYKFNFVLLSIIICSCIFFSGCMGALNRSVIDLNDSMDEEYTTSENSDIIEAKPTAVPVYDYQKLFIRNNLLNSIEKELYDCVYTSIINNQSVISFKNLDYTFSSVEELEDFVFNAVYSVFYDNPEIFWFDNAFKYSYSKSLNASEVEITLNQLYDESTIKYMQDSIDDVISLIVNETSGMNEYEKSKYVYTYIAQNTVYQKAENMNNVYGVLVDGAAVCEGYAKTYCYIMKRFGIECSIVTGNSSNEEHAWNIVKINGNYYYVDCTWGDPIIKLDSAERERLYVDYSYLHVTSEDIVDTHFRDELFRNIPELNSIEDNYYYRDGLYFDEYNEYNFANSLYNEIFEMNSNKKNNIEIKFKNKDDVNKAKKYIDDNLFLLTDGLRYEIDKYSMSSSELGTIKLVLSYR